MLLRSLSSSPRGLAAIGLVVVVTCALGWGLWRAVARKPEPLPLTLVPVTFTEPANNGGKACGPQADEPRTDPLVLIPVVSDPASPIAPSGAATNSPSTPLPTNRPAATAPPVPLLNYDERVLATQVALARRGFSAGSMDGVMGGQTRAALKAFQQAEGLPVSEVLDEATRAHLGTNSTLYATSVVTAEDLARLLPVGTTWLAKSQQARLDYESILELLAERTRSNPKLVRALNPQVDWAAVTAGTTVRLLSVEVAPPSRKAALIRIHTAGRYLQVFDGEGRVLAHFPCSIASRVEKRPVGETLHIVAVAPQPNYTFDPEVFPESAEARQIGRKLILPPGPNNPVGSVWFSLDKPGYGIHGTPRPEEVGRTESHGCFRLANWNAEHLLKLAGVGIPVEVAP